MHSRRLTFAVGTSLLTATLATGCSKNHTVNVKPTDEPHVNTGQEPAPEEQPADAPADETPDAEEPTEPPPDGPNVNTVPSK